MQLYVSPFAPNALRVQIAAAELGVPLELKNASEDRAAYLAVNPLGQVPALVTDEGRVITESLTICQFLDRIAATPTLFGHGADEAIEVAMWERRMEMALFGPAVEYGHQVHPMFAGMIRQFPDFAATLRPRIGLAAGLLAERVSGRDFVAADRFTVADITAGLGLAYALSYAIVTRDEVAAALPWFERLLERESFAPIRLFMTMTGAG